MELSIGQLAEESVHRLCPVAISTEDEDKELEMIVQRNWQPCHVLDRLGEFLIVSACGIGVFDEDGIGVSVGDLEALCLADVGGSHQYLSGDGVDLVEDGNAVEAVSEASAEPVDADQH